MKQIRVSSEKAKLRKDDIWPRWERESRYSKNGLLEYEDTYGPDAITECTFSYREDGLLRYKHTVTGEEDILDTFMEYDDKGRIANVKMVFNEGEATNTSVYNWSEDGQHCTVDVEEVNSSSEKMNWRFEETYKDDLLVKSVRHESDGRISAVDSYAHYPDGTLLEESLTRISGPCEDPVIETVMHSYDHAGRPAWSIYPEDDVLEYTYELDKEGNWISKKVWDHTGALADEIEREIEYWD